MASALQSPKMAAIESSDNLGSTEYLKRDSIVENVGSDQETCRVGLRTAQSNRWERNTKCGLFLWLNSQDSCYKQRWGASQCETTTTMRQKVKSYDGWGWQGTEKQGGQWLRGGWK